MATGKSKPIRKAKPAGKSERESSSKPARLLLFVGAGIAILLLAGVAAFWAMSGRGNVHQGIATEFADGSKPDQSSNASASPPPELQYKYSRQQDYLYEVEIDCQDEEGNPRTAVSTMHLEAYPELSSISTKANKCHVNSYGTGIGLPGNQIVVGSGLIRNAQSIEIKIGDKLYPAKKSTTKLAPPYLSLLEFEGPDFKPIRVNPYHDYERYPMVVQRDNAGLLYMRGRISSSSNSGNGPLDEHRFQGVEGSKKSSNNTYPVSPFNRTGVAFDRTGTFYGYMVRSDIIFPTALLESSLPASSFDETPLATRKRLTEQELAEAVGENLVTIHVTNPPAKDELVRGKISTTKVSPNVTFGPYKFGFEGSASLKWSTKEVTKVEKQKGSIPFFLGQCKDLFFVKLPEYGKATTSTEPVQKYYNNRRVAADSGVGPAKKLVPGTLTEELEYVKCDDTIATVQRKVSMEFPVAVQNASDSDPCFVTANQIINFDHVRGLVVDSKITGTLEYTNDGKRQTDDFEIRIRRVPNISKSPPEELLPLAETIAESIIERLKNGKANDKKKAIEELAAIDPVEHSGISQALAMHKPLSSGWKTSFYILAQRWILPQHVYLYLDRQELSPKTRSYEVDDVLQIIEFKPPTEKAKPWIRRGLISPQKQEYRNAARVLRNTYPEMVEELNPEIAAVTEYQDCHQEWLHCLKCVGDENCVPALEGYVEKIKSLGARYHKLHDHYVTLAERAISAAKQRPEKWNVASVNRSDKQAKSGARKFEVVEIELADRRRTGEIQLRKIILAALNYHDLESMFPKNIENGDGKPLLSWRVALLPQLGYEELFNKFKIDEPWDSEHNKKLLAEMPDVFQHPDIDAESKTVFLRFEGKGAILENGQNVRLRDVTDGTSNTIFCAEANPDSAAEWTRPADILFEPEKPSTQLGKIGLKSFNVVFSDGAVRALPNDVNPKALAFLIGRNDGKFVKFPK